MISLNEYSPNQLPPVDSHALSLSSHVFSEMGVLCDKLHLEHRPQQEAMALSIAGAMESDNPILFEAGTGVGKSLAYLIPGIIHAMDQSRQFIVSTHTISLQEQLEQKDIPLCRTIFKSSPETLKYSDFKATVLVGKNNYLCTTRLAAALKDKHELFSSPEHDELLRIAKWSETTETGLRHELNPPPEPEIWDLLNADSSACSRTHCDCEKCFYQRAKARIRNSNLLIVNHSLLFALMNAGGTPGGTTRGILYPDDFLVLDEGHTAPDIATKFFGTHLSSYGVNRILKYLYNPRKKRGLLKKYQNANALQNVLDCIDAAEQFFGQIHDRYLMKQAVTRIREEDFAEPYLDAPLQKLHDSIKLITDKMDDGAARDELLDQATRVRSLRASLTEILALSDIKNSVYWVERSGRRQSIVTLCTAPIDVAPLLRQHLFGRGTSVSLTSATLAIGGDIAPFQKRVGAEDASSHIESSPFDYDRNMRVYIATDIPPPSPQGTHPNDEMLIDYIDFCTRRTRGGSLVLFTSYQAMQKTADTLQPIYKGAQRDFFMQGEGHNRTELARKLRESRDGILFGTDSFWTGIDIPGDSLSQVIITRLPFEVPTHPILEARTERIMEEGGNPFNELSLPDALMKFRQGVGRLIRSQKDRGVITILDPRIVQKPYGRLFLDTLPTKNYARMTELNRVQKFQPFI